MTFNLKHFPAVALAPHGLDALNPDALLCRLLDYDLSAARAAVEELRQSLQKPAYDPAIFYQRLEQVGLPVAAERLREAASELKE